MKQETLPQKTEAGPGVFTESDRTESLPLPAEFREKTSEIKTETGSSGYPVSEGVRFNTALKLQALRQSVLADPFIEQELAYYVAPHGDLGKRYN
jgi:hypothetical protein